MAKGTVIVRHGNHGDAVRQIQNDLITVGVPLPRYGADGWYGDETENALAFWAAGHGIIKIPGVATAELVEALRNVAEHFVSPQNLPSCFSDQRNNHAGHARSGKRSWGSITGITLHQTATCLLHEDKVTPDRLKGAIERACGIAVHHVILRNGVSVWSNPYDSIVPQAQRVFNARDVGIEVDGYYAGVEGDDSTFWRPKSTPDRQPMGESGPQFMAARETCRFIIEEVARHGGKIKYIHAHRQTSMSRISDPGELIWREIAEPIIEEFGLSFGGPDFYVPQNTNITEKDIYSGSGPGYPIPREWSPRGTWGYRERPKTPAKQV